MTQKHTMLLTSNDVEALFTSVAGLPQSSARHRLLDKFLEAFRPSLPPKPIVFTHAELRLLNSLKPEPDLHQRLILEENHQS